MSDVKIFWDPSGIELDSLGSKKLVSVSDGDTPIISVSIRMLSIDTPEKKYQGNPSNYDDKFVELANWIDQGKAPVNDSLANYIKPKLATGVAGTLQETQGKMASKKFEELLDAKLTKPSGRKRQLFVKSANEPFDFYGRLLAYVSPKYTSAELSGMSYEDRATFNYLMVKSGWAAPFIIYPSLPKQSDLVMLYEASKLAVENGLGAWAEPEMLTGYEFRMCVKLYKITKQLIAGKKLSSSQKYGYAVRYCADLTSKKIVYPQDYYQIQPFNRLFIWAQDVNEAVGNLNLISG